MARVAKNTIYTQVCAANTVGLDQPNAKCKNPLPAKEKKSNILTSLLIFISSQSNSTSTQCLLPPPLFCSHPMDRILPEIYVVPTHYHFFFAINNYSILLVNTNTSCKIMILCYMFSPYLADFLSEMRFEKLVSE